MAERRRKELLRLVNDLVPLNPDRVPVILAGDFNSYKGRTYDSVGKLLESIGLYDAFDQARIIGYQHYNSFNGFRTNPAIGITWGDHLDHFWVDPNRMRVWSWYNAAQFVGGKYATPIPSDHNPITMVLRVG